MIFIALQFEHGVLRRALLALCDLQLVARFGKLAFGVLGGLGGKVELFGKTAAPRRQLAPALLRMPALREIEPPVIEPPRFNT